MAEPLFGTFHAVRIFAVWEFSDNADSRRYNFNPHGECYYSCIEENENWREKMSGYLIKDTTKEQREQIVSDSLGNISASCDGCMPGLAEMYQEYIDGKKEIREINRIFQARYVSGEDGPGVWKGGCGFC